jgi:hypothetical protein
MGSRDRLISRRCSTQGGAVTSPSSHDDALPVNRQRDCRDLAITDLTHSLIETERQRDTYRELLQLSLAQLHGLTITNRRLRARLRQVPDTQRLGYLDEQQRGFAA